MCVKVRLEGVGSLLPLGSDSGLQAVWQAPLCAEPCGLPKGVVSKLPSLSQQPQVTTRLLCTVVEMNEVSAV